MTTDAEMEFRLHPDVDPEALNARFQRQRRISIEPFIVAEQAEHLRQYLLQRGDWRMKLKTAAERVYDLPRAELTAEQSAGLRALASPLASDSFTYAYDRIVADGDASTARNPLEAFRDFLCSNVVVDLVRAITGEPRTAFADAFASRYGPGDFLTVHRDAGDSNRLAAYVFGLTANWRPEWGGLLMFHAQNGDVALGLCPRFNVLNLFAVPQDHSVSLVAPFASEPRLSVTGWFHSATS